MNVCQHVSVPSIEVTPGHYEVIHFGAPGKCIMEIQVRRNDFPSVFHSDRSILVIWI